MKSLIATICILGLVGMVVGVAVKAADTAPVTATVTVQNISVTVAPASFDYGFLAAGAESAASAVITATNNGNVTENFGIRGAGTAAWTLGSTAGTETYVHKFSTDATYVTWTALTTPGYQTLAAGVIVGTGTDDFKLKITVPTVTASYAQQSAVVTVLASE